MTWILVAVIAVLLVERTLESRRRDSESERWRKLLAAERHTHLQATERLLQRIQAPEVAVAEHAAQGPVSMPAAVPPDDDQEYWRARAEAEPDIAEALARMEALEAERRQLLEFDARQA